MTPASSLPDIQAIEYFHLVFLDVLQVRLDQRRYVVKGGVNLRYFFGSPRYSEDVDLDAVAIEPWTLEDKVDDVLASPAMTVLLRNGGLELGDVTKPKQTETTRRWKLALARERGGPVRTKIEFSHRGPDSRRALEAVPQRVVAPYALRAPTVMHYTADAAIEQKIVVLARRSETQARDVFDLELLLRTHPDVQVTSDVGIRHLAAQRALDLPFQAFRDQVLPFLDPEIAELHADPGAWERMQLFVANEIESLR